MKGSGLTILLDALEESRAGGRVLVGEPRRGEDEDELGEREVRDRERGLLVCGGGHGEWGVSGGVGWWLLEVKGSLTLTRTSSRASRERGNDA